jgi:hypothetical protein
MTLGALPVADWIALTLSCRVEAGRNGSRPPVRFWPNPIRKDIDRGS